MRGHEDAFDSSRSAFAEVVDWLETDKAAGLTHAELEDQLGERGRELLRRMYQDHLALRAHEEARVEVTTPRGWRMAPWRKATPDPWPPSSVSSRSSGSPTATAAMPTCIPPTAR